MINIEFVNGETIGIILFFIGFFGLTSRRNIIKSVISLGIMDVAIILYFIAVTSAQASSPPIGDIPSELMADPLPQAMMITAIVIGISVTAVNLTLFIALYHRYNTTNWEKSKNYRQQELLDD